MIRKAVSEDLPVILATIILVKKTMLEEGNPQWDSDYPGEKEYSADIEREELFVEVDTRGGIRGFMCLNRDLSKEYDDISWETPFPALGIHRLAVNIKYRRLGVAKALFSFAEEYARLQGCRSLHVDTFTFNTTAQNFFVRNGCRFAGEIYMKGRSEPYRCYEKEV